MNNELNSKLFNEFDELKPNIRDALLDVAYQFIEDIKEDTEIDAPISDIILVGSNASYNYTEYSDIDIHIVTDLSKISRCDPELAGKLMNSERYIFNQNYDIEIQDIEAEVYVEDINSNTISNGIYSIINNEWIKYPKIEDSSIDYDIEEDPLYLDIIDDIKELLEYSNLTSEDIENTIDNIYLMRKYSLAKEGEYGTGNLIFKQIRNIGLLDKLKDKLYELRSDELSY